MKAFLKLLAVIAAIVFLSVVLTPWLYDVLPWRFKFERIFNRLIMIGTLISVVLFVRIRADTLKRYGLWWEGKRSGVYLWQGFSLGFGVLVLLAVLKITLGLGTWAPAAQPFGFYLGKVLMILATAFLIGLIEEFFFRGFVFNAFKTKFGWNLPLSILVTNLFYAIVHFVSFQKPFIGGDPNWHDSLKLVWYPFFQLAYFPSFWHEAVGLFIFGILLNAIVVRTGSLYPAIALHAGCVFFIKMDGLLMHFTNQNVIFYSSSKMYDGFLGWLALGAMLWSVSFVFHKREAERMGTL